MDMEAKIDRVLEIVNDVRINQAEQAVILARNTEDMRTHIKRTNLLEKQVEKALFPIKALKYIVGGVGVVAAVISGVYGVVQIFIR